MKKIVLNKPVVETIEFAAALNLENLRNKIVVQVYNQTASVLVKAAPSLDFSPKITDAFAFAEISKGFDSNGFASINLRTDGVSKQDAFDNLKERLIVEVQKNEMEYFIFDSLADFAAAIIANGWH